MVHLTSSQLMLLRQILKHHTRHISKYLHRDICSKVIRQKFLDYFIVENGHNFVKSSPVVPFCDPTVPFVNAGMNQFKGVFLGTQAPEFKRVANSQKCVRVGGKHNDLNVVGTDGYHHTFFEMLGSWSFGDYFKADACKMAWDLLTNVYRLPKSRLYVTYFKGDPDLGVKEDVETKEIWLALGVPNDRILPFGVKDNFWEMGLVGPCGPCTEIHVDHSGSNNRANFVNKGLHDLTEVWNIVFIEYNRNPDQSISLLPQKHVDTGMGFERLTAILQGKTSSYDTDIFEYLLEAIRKNCSGVEKYGGKFGENDWNSLDTNYRILADHCRMITVCLGDGVIPEENKKLRRILRKAFLLSDTVFNNKQGLIKELSNYIIDHLGPIYPEMERNTKQIHQIIDYEENIYKSLRGAASKDWEKLTKENPMLLTLDIIEAPSVITAYKEISSTKQMSPDLAFKLYDTYGLEEDLITKLCQAVGISFNPDDLTSELDKAKLRSRKGRSLVGGNDLYNKLLKMNLPKTDDSAKYDYRKENNEYKFDELNVQVLKILENDEFVTEISPEIYCALLLDKTNLYSEAGGQSTDQGVIHFPTGSFEIHTTEYVDGHILHHGFFHSATKSKLNNGAAGVLTLDAKRRISSMCNHTATHLLNSALKEVKGATCQKSSKVLDTHLSLDVAIFDNKLTMEELAKIEERIVRIIAKKRPVLVKEFNSQQLLSLDSVTTIPGEFYPDSHIRVVEVVDKDFVSREPCCGTHVKNTGDLQDFCIVGLKSLGRSTTSITAVTSHRAALARANACEIMDEISNLQKTISDNIDKPNVLDMAVVALKQKLNYNVNDANILPVYIKHDCLEKLKNISEEIKDSARGSLRDFIDIEMKNALESNTKITKSNKKYIIHYLRTSMILETVPLQRATKLCGNLPVLIISYANNEVKARCCVPKELVTENFSAEKWLKKTVATVFNSRAAPQKGQDGNLVCNMKGKRVHLQEWDTMLNQSLEIADKYVQDNL